MQTNFSKNLSLVIISVVFIYFGYLLYKDIDIINRRYVDTAQGVYSSYVSDSPKIKAIATYLIEKCDKDSRLCQVQSLLDFVTAIPYHTQTFQKKKPLQVIKDNFGDCDDKSNLLISLLHSIEVEAYFVLVPKHIFVVVSLDDQRLQATKGLWINGKKYYILESTATGSKVGFPLQYKLNQIDTIVEPFSNNIIKVKELEFF
jgi:transglutaminase-like putative cysteine protease